MERLTLDEAIKYTKEIARANRVEAENYIPTTGPYYNANLECANQYEQISMWIKELKSYKDLEEQGLLVRLPCKVGDTVYVPTRTLVSEFKITTIFCDILGTYFYWLFCCGICERTNGFSERDIGKTVFLTREEAEKKLEEMKNGL